MERMIFSCASGENSVLRHTGAQPGFNFFHARLRALEAHGAAQVFRFAASKVGGDHRETKQLLLKKRHTERTFEHRFERRMRIRYLFPSLPAQ